VSTTVAKARGDMSTIGRNQKRIAGPPIFHDRQAMTSAFTLVHGARPGIDGKLGGDYSLDSEFCEWEIVSPLLHSSSQVVSVSAVVCSVLLEISEAARRTLQISERSVRNGRSALVHVVPCLWLQRLLCMDTM
jgi:hypothetical protein